MATLVAAVTWSGRERSGADLSETRFSPPETG
jgi:hypothetical protein